MPKPSWLLTLHGNLGCAIFDADGTFLARPLTQEAMGMLLVECLQTLRKHEILINPTHRVEVRRASELDVGPEVELDVPTPEPESSDDA